MKPRTATLSLTAIALALLASCGEEAVKGANYPHIATPYEEDYVWTNPDEGGGGTTPTGLSGGWFNIGQLPGVFLKVAASGTEFEFVDSGVAIGAGHQNGYYVDWFCATDGDVETGTVSGSSVTWHNEFTATGRTADFTGTATATSITGNMEYNYSSPQSQSLQLVRVPSLFAGATAVTPGAGGVSFTLDPAHPVKVIKVTPVVSASIRVSVATTTTDAWVWVFNNEGTPLRAIDLVFTGTETYENILLPQDYYFFVTQFESTPGNVTVLVEDLTPDADN
jgi:hypothetical protein